MKISINKGQAIEQVERTLAELTRLQFNESGMTKYSIKMMAERIVNDLQTASQK